MNQLDKNYEEYILVILVFLFLSCKEDKRNNDSAGELKTTDISSNIQISELEIISGIFNSELKIWGDYSKKLNPEFSANSFVLDTTKKLSFDIVRDFSFTENLESEYYYNYSPDSTKIIDIYSYNAKLERVNGKIRLMHDVDSEALLIDLKERKSYRLLFFGTTVTLDDAAWINDSSLIITGFSEIMDQVNVNTLYRPTIWYFDLGSKKINIYYCNAPAERAKPNYYKIRFPKFES